MAESNTPNVYLRKIDLTLAHTADAGEGSGMEAKARDEADATSGENAPPDEGRGREDGEQQHGRYWPPHI